MGIYHVRCCAYICCIYTQAPDSAIFHIYLQIVYTAILNLVLDLDLVLNLVLDKFSTRLGCLLSSSRI
jgi:hypothetical protein